MVEEMTGLNTLGHTQNKMAFGLYCFGNQARGWVQTSCHLPPKINKIRQLWIGYWGYQKYVDFLLILSNLEKHVGVPVIVVQIYHVERQLLYLLMPITLGSGMWKTCQRTNFDAVINIWVRCGH